MGSYGYIKAFWDVVPFKYKSEKAREKLIRKRLSHILEFARTNTKFYHDRIPENWSSIEDIAPTTKEEFLSNFDDTLTDKRINYDIVLQQMNRQPPNGTLLGKYFIAATSGSSGKPLVTVQDRIAADRDTIASVFRNVRFGFPCASISSPEAFALSTERIRKNQKESKYVERVVSIISSLEPPLTQAKKLKEKNAKTVFGYSSSIVLLANAAWENHITYNANRVYLSGEPFTEDDIARIKRVFPKARVQGIYGCTEGGAMAYECKYGHMHINSDLVLIEAVDKNGKSVPYDTLSDQTYITNFSNHVQPLIRMEIGDRITLHHGCPCGRKDDWVEVQGRTNDILSFVGDNGKTVNCTTSSLRICIEHISKKGLMNFREFQAVIHKTNTIEIRLDCYDPTQIDDVFICVKERLTSYFSSLGVNNLTIYLSDKLPQNTTSSGKRKRIYVADF